MRWIGGDALLEIAQVFNRNRLRTGLTAAGVFWGVFMLLMMQGFGTGMENGVSLTMADNVSNSVFIWSQKTSMPYQGNRPGRRLTIRNADVAALQQIPGLEYVTPRLQLGGFRSGTIIKQGERVGSFEVMGDVPDFAYIQPMELLEGRFINERDITERRKVIVVGEQVYRELFEAGRPAEGQRLTVDGIDFLVVGRFQARTSGDSGERIESRLHIPLSTFQRAFNTGDRVGWLALTGEAQVRVSVLEEDAKAILASRHSVHPGDPQAFGSYNAQEGFQRIQNLFAATRAMVWFVGLMTLLSGVIGVSNVMLISVAERTREIGIRRAIGASRLNIVWLILREATLLTAAAGYAGLIAGLLAVEALRLLLGDSSAVLREPRVDVFTAVTAAVLLIIAGAISGILPAWRAANIHPVEALRAE